jgi:hypothetical protein
MEYHAMNRRNVLVGGAVMIAIAALGAWWLNTYERVAREIDGPMRGVARYNPLYALERTLDAFGLSVRSRAVLEVDELELEESDLLVLGTDVRTLTSEQVDDLEARVATGVHLVFELPARAGGRRGELLERFGLTVSENGDCLRWRVGDGDDWAVHCSTTGFHVEEGDEGEFEVLLGDAERGYALGRRALGAGTWTVAADLDFLANRELNDDGHAALAWQVLAPALAGGDALLVYAADVPPLHVLLVRYGWTVILPLALALLAWLWHRSARLGPLLPALATDRRALREHVQAAGEFAYRRGRAGALHAAMRRALFAQWQRRDPALAALESEALVRELAARGGRDPETVRRALYPADLGRPERFVAAIRILMELKPRP